MDNLKAPLDPAHQELHRIPLKYLAVPTHIHVVGFKLEPGGREPVLKNFYDLAAARGADAITIQAHETRACATREDNDMRLLLKLDLSQNHYTIQTWTTTNKPRFGGPSVLDGLVWDGREKLTELEIVWLPDRLDEQGVRAFFPDQTEVLSSLALSGKIQIATDYEPDLSGRERYLIVPLKDEPAPGQSEFVVDNIIRIENHFHLLFFPKQNYEQAVKGLADIESDTTAEMQALNDYLPKATTEDLKEALHRLSSSFVRLAKLSDEFQHHFSDAIRYKETLKTAFKAWREQPIDNYLPLSAPILRSAITISNDYGQLLARIERVRRQKTDIINILRTKIDLLERDQSLALQKSMHETTKSQMAMQLTIEGLYVFIVAFYLTELARIVFEALEERHIIDVSPNLLAALFIPAAIAAGLVLSGKAAHWRRRR